MIINYIDCNLGSVTKLFMRIVSEFIENMLRKTKPSTLMYK